MRFTRCLIFAAAFASLAFAGGAAAEPRHAPRIPPRPERVAPPPLPRSWSMMDPWMMFDPFFMGSPMMGLGYDSMLGGPGSPSAMVDQMMNDMNRDMSTMRRGMPMAPMGTGMGGPLLPGAGMGFGDDLLGFGSAGGGSAAAQAWSYSSETDANGCTRSTQSSQTWPGGPQTSSSATGNCSGARRPAPEPDDEDYIDEDEEEPEF